ncbi:hypothetical protein ACLOJK_007686, partial [Asimina triloba]
GGLGERCRRWQRTVLAAGERSRRVVVGDKAGKTSSAWADDVVGLMDGSDRCKRQPASGDIEAEGFGRIDGEMSSGRKCSGSSL